VGSEGPDLADLVGRPMRMSRTNAPDAPVIAATFGWLPIETSFTILGAWSDREAIGPSNTDLNQCYEVGRPSTRTCRPESSSQPRQFALTSALRVEG